MPGAIHLPPAWLYSPPRYGWFFCLRACYALRALYCGAGGVGLTTYRAHLNAYGVRLPSSLFYLADGGRTSDALSRPRTL